MTPFRRSLLKFAGAGGAAVVLLGLLWRDQSAPLEGRQPTDSRRKAEGTGMAPSAGEVSGVLDPKTAATVERIRGLLDAIEPVLPGELENATALELLRWWADLEPVAAIRFAASHPGLHGRTGLPVELFVAWLAVKNTDALNWFTGLAAGDLRTQLLPAVISIVAGQQPQEALRLAAELSGENRRTALSALFSEWSAANPVTAAEQAIHLDDAQEQNLALRAVVGKWMDRDPAAAIAWAKRLPPQPGPDSLDVLPPVTGVLIEKWAAQAPADAAAYLVSLPEGAGRSRLLRTVAGQWAGASPTEALAWTVGIDRESDRELMVRGVLGSVAQTDVQAAAELALTLRSGNDLPQALSLVMDQWTARDPAGVAVWADSLVERPATREALTSVVIAWAGTDPRSLGQWLSSLPVGDARDACCAAMVHYLAPREPRLAAQWAGSITNPVLRAQQTEALARGR